MWQPRQRLKPHHCKFVESLLKVQSPLIFSFHWSPRNITCTHGNNCYKNAPSLACFYWEPFSAFRSTKLTLRGIRFRKYVPCVVMAEMSLSRKRLNSETLSVVPLSRTPSRPQFSLGAYFIFHTLARRTMLGNKYFPWSRIYLWHSDTWSNITVSKLTDVFELPKTEFSAIRK